MDPKEPKTFGAKHPAGRKPDSAIGAEIQQRIKDNNLTCQVAFEIAEKLGTTPQEIGQTADLMDVRLAACQLGLFGYQPQKKIVAPLSDIASDLQAAITSSQDRDRLTCEAAWEIAARLQIPKMRVSGACEALSLKIKACQLGAF